MMLLDSHRIDLEIRGFYLSSCRDLNLSNLQTNKFWPESVCSDIIIIILQERLLSLDSSIHTYVPMRYANGWTEVEARFERTTNVVQSKRLVTLRGLDERQKNLAIAFPLSRNNLRYKVKDGIFICSYKI